MRSILLALTLVLAACAATPPAGLNAADMKIVSSIHTKTLENWGAMPYINSAKRSATVHIVLKPDGTVADLAITKSSGISAFDNGLLIAIRRAAPFSIPSSKKGGNLEYGLVFTK